MKRQVKIGSVVLMIIMLSTLAAAAVQKPVVQQAGSTHQLVIGAQDVITASDAGGGRLSSRDLIIMIAIGVGVIILIMVL
jgi:hypothetical protein